METRKCKKCEKVIEGYHKNHVDYMMMQHELKHRKGVNENKNKKA
jgi:hypothetical protein